MTQTVNLLVLTACIVEFDTLRYTPSGLPAVNIRLEHVSVIEEAGHLRQVNAVVKSVAFGVIAERLVKQAVNSSWKFNGFLATPRNGKHPVFHIQEFQQIS